MKGMDNKVKSLLSICMKAGLLKVGEVSAEKSLQAKTAQLIIISEDASDNTKKKFINKSFYYNVPTRIYGDRDEISRTIGRENRVVLAVTDKSLSSQIEKIIDGSV